MQVLRNISFNQPTLCLHIHTDFEFVEPMRVGPQIFALSIVVRLWRLRDAKCPV